jgi:hypothetical protein
VARRSVDNRGQASVEAVAGVGALVLTGLLCLQLLAAGYTTVLADGAAQAGAVAAVRGQSVDGAVRKALPGWARSRFSVVTAGGSVRVRLQPPSPFRHVADRLTVSAKASAKAG